MKFYRKLEEFLALNLMPPVIDTVPASTLHPVETPAANATEKANP
jgi:hypothetical protein